MKAYSLVLALACALCLTACGGSGGGGALSTDATLAALTLSGGAPSTAFDPAVTAYTLDGGLFLASTNVTPTASEQGATVTVDGMLVASGEASEAIELAVGPNPVLIVVTATDGTTQETYTVVVTRAASATQAPYLKASNAHPVDEFGGSVSISGDTLVVGATGEDSSAAGGAADDSAPSSGAAYVFVRTGATWTQQAYLKASNAERDDQFGISVSIWGDTLVVGAIGEESGAGGGEADNSATFAGAAYVFVRSGTTWLQQAYLKASNAEENDAFGRDVSISGDTLVVAARFEDASAGGGEADNSATNAGAVYVFVRTGTTWAQQAYLKAPNADQDDEFGTSVSISGNTLAVGAIREASAAGAGQADNSAPGAGAVYVFVRAGTTWAQQAHLKASNAEGGDQFGSSVSVLGATLVVGALAENSSAGGGEADNSVQDAGAAYVFVRTGTTWTQQAYLKASNAGTGDRFGDSVGISGDTLVVGAKGEDSSAAGGEADNSANGAGAVYVIK